jgi:apolipoprotein D and lipocalin family protein
MQFIWPIKADYRITYLDAGYRITAIGREKRDYVWIMARTPQIPESDYAQVVGHLEQQGYDVTRLRRVPQRWPSGSKTTLDTAHSTETTS